MAAKKRTSASLFDFGFKKVKSDDSGELEGLKLISVLTAKISPGVQLR